jgi:putative Holliday junction resolvase
MTEQLLCFDFGLNSIGIATGQTTLGIATPLPEMKAKQGSPDWTALGELIAEWDAKLLLIGLPLNMDGTESELSAKARKFANRLNGRFNLPIEMVDERLTSHSAKEETGKVGHKGDYKKKPIDSVAACLILEQFFNDQK